MSAARCAQDRGGRALAAVKLPLAQEAAGLRRFAPAAPRLRGRLSNGLRWRFAARRGRDTESKRYRRNRNCRGPFNTPMPESIAPASTAFDACTDRTESPAQLRASHMFPRSVIASITIPVPTAIRRMSAATRTYRYPGGGVPIRTTSAGGTS